MARGLFLIGALAILGVGVSGCGPTGTSVGTDSQPDEDAIRHAAGPPAARLALDGRPDPDPAAARTVYVLCNVDDDDGNGRPDRDDVAIDADVDDLTHVVLGRLDEPTTDALVVRLASPATFAGGPPPGVRIFDPDGRVRLGPDAEGPKTVWELAPSERDGLAEDDLSLYLEGVRFGACETLEVVRGGEVTDRVGVRVSPLELAPSCGTPAEIVYSFLPSGIDSWADAFLGELEPVLDEVGLGGARRVRIALDPNKASDWFVQDQLQWAYTETPERRLPVVILLPRQGPLREPCRRLLGPGVGLVVPVELPPPEACLDGSLYGGNVEVLPSLAAGVPGCVYGGFVAASATAQQSDPGPLASFLQGCTHQSLVALSTSLTYVGHADELVAFLPPEPPEAPTAHLLVASPGAGVARLDDPTLPQETPDPRIHVDGAPAIDGASARWDDLLSAPVNGLQTMTLRAYNVALEARIHGATGAGTPIYAGLRAYLDASGVPVEVVRVPTLFRPAPLADTIENGYENDLHASGVALVPNMVNLVAFPGHVVTAHPTVAGFLDVLRRALPQDGEPGHVEVHAIDVFDLLHQQRGGIHCATNVRYEPTGNYRWWEQGG